jgi:hypothetical protein
MAVSLRLAEVIEILRLLLLLHGMGDDSVLLICAVLTWNWIVRSDIAEAKY